MFIETRVLGRRARPLDGWSVPTPPSDHDGDEGITLRRLIERIVRAEVRAFYANIGDISLPYLLTVQFVRGLMWAGIVLLLVRALRGGVWLKASLSGLALSVIMDLQLLYPNPVMPWPVRSVHMVEVGISNFVFGALAVLILTARRARSV